VTSRPWPRRPWGCRPLSGSAAHPGQLPALPHEAYAAAVAPSTRCRLAAALARAWVYGGDSGRAGGFARDAEQLAMDLRDPVLLADALGLAAISCCVC